MTTLTQKTDKNKLFFKASITRPDHRLLFSFIYKKNPAILCIAHLQYYCTVYCKCILAYCKLHSTHKKRKIPFVVCTIQYTVCTYMLVYRLYTVMDEALLYSLHVTIYSHIIHKENILSFTVLLI